jgi:hypothetical protein
MVAALGRSHDRPEADAVGRIAARDLLIPRRAIDWPAAFGGDTLMLP